METSQMSSAPAAAASAPVAELPLSPNAMSALGYFFAPVAIAALVMKQYENNAEVRFHAVQSLLTSAAFIAGSMAFGMVTAIVTGISGVIFGALNLYAVMSVLFIAIQGLTGLLSLAAFGLWVTLIVTAANGKRFMVPYLGAMAEKMAKR